MTQINLCHFFYFNYIFLTASVNLGTNCFFSLYELKLKAIFLPLPLSASIADLIISKFLRTAISSTLESSKTLAMLLQIFPVVSLINGEYMTQKYKEQ